MQTTTTPLFEVNQPTVSFTHDDLVNIFSTAELYNSEYFDVTIPKKFKELKSVGGVDKCWEDTLVNVLANGGYIVVADIEDAGDANEIVTIEEANKYKNSTVLNVDEIMVLELGMWRDIFYCPAYRIDMNRISTAMQEIVSGNMTCEDPAERVHLKRCYNNMFVRDNYDFYDGWNIFQYIVFGDVIYG